LFQFIHPQGCTNVELKGRKTFLVYFLLRGEKWKSFCEEKMATKEKSIKLCCAGIKDFRCRDLPTASTYKMEIRCLAADQSLLEIFYPEFKSFLLNSF
jgi:hypothetical protein